MRHRYQSILVRCLASAILGALPANAAVNFTFTYSGTGGTLWSQAAKDSLTSAADTVSALFSNYNATIPMQVSGSNAMTSTLASAGANFTTTPMDSFGTRGDVAELILSNGSYTLGSTGFAGTVDANFVHNWSFTNMVSGTEYDFTSTMIHELTHALGFNSLIAQGGGSEFGDRKFSTFDSFVADGSHVKAVDLNLATGTGAVWTTASVGGTGTVPATFNTGLYFDGPNAVAANGGNLIPIFSPNPWQTGSSGSHLDDTFYTGTNAKLMNSATDFGPGVRNFDPIEIGILKDLGYAQVIPEPRGSMLLCFGAAFALCGRKRRSVI